MVVSVTSCDVSHMTRLTQEALLFSGSRAVPRTPRSAIVSRILVHPSTVAETTEVPTKPMLKQLIRYNARKEAGDAGDQYQGPLR
jgi:hypothetical protein